MEISYLLSLDTTFMHSFEKTVTLNLDTTENEKKKTRKN